MLEKFLGVMVVSYHKIYCLRYEIHSVGSNPVCGFRIRDFWRVQVGSLFSFDRRTWVSKGSKFGFSRFGPGLAFDWGRSLVLTDQFWFE